MASHEASRVVGAKTTWLRASLRVNQRCAVDQGTNTFQSSQPLTPII